MDVDAAWDIVERAPAEHVPAVTAALRGAGGHRAPERDGRPRAAGRLPADFVASLRRHDGQDNPTRFLDLIDHYTLLGVEDGDGIWLDDD